MHRETAILTFSGLWKSFFPLPEMKFINNKGAELSATWFGARTINMIDELPEVVTPKTILFRQDGITITFLDCPWDVEHRLRFKLFQS